MKMDIDVTETETVPVFNGTSQIGTISSGETLGKIKDLVRQSMPGVKKISAYADDTKLEPADLNMTLSEYVGINGDVGRIILSASVSPSGA
jgi:hypothetical protein